MGYSVRKTFRNFVKKQFCRRRKHLIFLPYDIQPGLQSGLQRAEAEVTVLGGVCKVIQSDRVADPGVHQDRRIVDKAECGDDIQLFKVFSKPVGKGIPRLMGRDRLPRADQRKIQEVFLFYMLFFCKGTVLS